MNKKLFTLLITMILTFSSLKAFAVVIPDEKVKAEISKQLLVKFKKYTNADLEIVIQNLPFVNLTLPDGKVSYCVKPTAEDFAARDLVKVEISVNGKLQKVFNAPVLIKAYENVLVASGVIQREAQLNLSNVKIERREISNKYNHVLTQKDLSKELYAKKYFVKGELIDDRFVKAKPAVLRNSLVTVYFNTNNLTISLDGIALSDGIIGERITVLNKKYNRVYKGEVIGENRILVRI